ncbi:MAG: serine/threonine protein kinase [Myxococcales bacterium]|nr:serine/threonine protein kinase [Myxococcales bacterium]
MADLERSELVGTVIDGHYRLVEILGIGGTGVVFEATRLHDAHPVVLKVLRHTYAQHVDLRRRLLREAEISQRLSHPGLARFLDTGRLEDSSPYLVAERLRGESLSRLLRRFGTLSVQETSVIFARVASILHHVHGAGYVHRDIKPEHILLDRRRDGGLDVKLIDFGVCASETAPSDERARERGRVFGTPSYCAPEQACGDPEVDGRADVFGMGVCVFECLAGRLPFRASNVTSLLKRILREDAPRVGLVTSHVGVEMDALVARAMAREREQRYPSARAFARALQPFAGSAASIERRLAATVRSASAIAA